MTRRSRLSSKRPSWWDARHSSAWANVKAAMRRDWEQTKNDYAKPRGHHLAQTAGDTLAQASGREPVPPDDEPNRPPMPGALADWEAAEAALRFGVGARVEYSPEDARWREELIDTLRQEWEGLKVDCPWCDAQPYVRYGWQAGGNTIF